MVVYNYPPALIWFLQGPDWWIKWMETITATSFKVLKAALISTALGKQYCAFHLMSWQGMVGSSTWSSLLPIHRPRSHVRVMPTAKCTNLNSGTGEMTNGTQRTQCKPHLDQNPVNWSKYFSTLTGDHNDASALQITMSPRHWVHQS